MTIKVDKIIIVGGGSAGWMTAASLVTQLKNKEIYVIESPNIPTVGVGESTVGGIRGWLRMVGIRDSDFISHTDASYKLAIRFNNFYNEKGGTWYYPFGRPYLKENLHGRDDWFIKKAIYPETPTDDYVTSMYSQMALVHANKICTNNPDLDGFDFYNDTAFHFDAAKMGAWLRDYHCIPKGVKLIRDTVKEIYTDQNGISSLLLESGQTINADLYVDCTGFKSLLLGGALKEPFDDYQHILPNNRAWATRIPYTDKEKQLNSVTDCTALDIGWVWNIPLWSRIGTGYVYSDKYIDPVSALNKFKKYLVDKNLCIDEAEFRDIEMRVGKHKRLFVKNVVALGLSAAFIEPLESTGLLTTHEFARSLCNILVRDHVSQWDRDEFNLKCEDEFNYWVQFVSMHYALSHRIDSEYWRDIGQKSYVALSPRISNFQTQSLYYQTLNHKSFIKFFQDDDGINCLAAGMNYNANDIVTLNNIFPVGTDLKHEFDIMIRKLEFRKRKWKEAVKTAPSLYQFLLNSYFNT
jgi:tryptophan halogenase